MATQVQLRRGTTAQNNSFTGALGEVTVDTDKDTVVVHDGGTAGGFPLAREDASNLTFPDGSVGSPAISFASDTNTGIYRGGTDILKFVTAGQDRLTIDANGNVGIANSSPATLGNSSADDLVVGTTSGDKGITVVSGASGTGRIAFADSGDTLAGRIVYDHNTNGMSFGTGGASQHMTLDSSGNLLVGTTNTNPSGSNVEGSVIQPDGMLRISREGDVIEANRKTSDGNILVLKKDGANVGFIGTSSGFLYAGHDDVGLIFRSNESIRPYNPSTRSERDAQIDLGVGAVRFKDLYLSGGVYLGGTGSANKLDDYEEGTWTPAISTTTGSITINSSFSGGSYTKIGDTVMAWAKIRPLSQSSPTGGLDITGLPFTAKSSSGTNAGGVGQGIVEGSYSSDPNIVLAQVGASSTSITLRRRNGATSTNDMATYLVDGNYYSFTVIYKI